MTKIKKKIVLNIKHIGIFIFIIFIFYLVIVLPFSGKIYPNIYIANTYVGDSNPELATIKLKEKLIPEKIYLTTGDTKSEILVSEILLSINYQKSIDRAYNYTSTGNLLTDTQNRIKLIFKPANFALFLEIDEKKLLESVLITTSKLGTKPTPPSATIANGQVSVSAGTNGIEVDTDKIVDDIKNNLSNLNNREIEIALNEISTSLNHNELENYRIRANKLVGSEITLVFEDKKISLDDSTLVGLIKPIDGYYEDKIIDHIENASKTINRSPQNSVFVVENNKVVEFTPSLDGVTVDEDRSVNEIKTGLENILKQSSSVVTINLPVIKTSAKIKNEDVNSLGIKTLIGKGFSTFKGSIANRIYNVNLAQSKFRGLLISPNEEVSFNQILGDVSGLTGYKQAYVIKDGKTVLGDGGGVCQVSTTLFRALLDTGLPITERRAHAYRVGYYEQGFPPGLDATIYSPTTDLKFINNTPAYILIQPTIDLSNLTLAFEIYGTDDGRIATTTKPVITSQSAPPADLYVDDPTLPVGTVKQIEHKAWGAKVIFDYHVEKNGEVLTDQKFVSNYRPWGAVYLRGTAL